MRRLGDTWETCSEFKIWEILYLEGGYTVVKDVGFGASLPRVQVHLPHVLVWDLGKSPHLQNGDNNSTHLKVL